MNQWTRLALGAACALVLLAAGASSALALTPTNAPLAGSNFQGADGDQANPAGDVSNPPDGVNDIDWQALAGTIPTTVDDNAVDSMFEGGDKETEPGLWGISSKAGGVTPSKDNLLAAWSTSSPNVSGPPNTYLYLAFTRAAQTGNTFNTFELNQLAQTWNNGQSTIACRTTGDLLISYEVASGGTPPNVDIVVYRWTSTTVDAATGCGKTGTFQAITPGPAAEAAMNAGAITNYLSPATLGSSFAAGTFGEAALNLTGILSGANLNPCENFGQISMHTRSSTSIDSALQDYISPTPVLVRSCSLAITKTGSSPHHDGDPETFTYDVTNDGSVPVAVSKASNIGVTDDKCGPVTYVSGDTNNDGNVDTNETWHFTCSYTVKHSDENASHQIINTATVHGSVGDTPITRSTTYTTDVIHPAIDVTKTATESAVHVGDTIHYTVTVKNTGDTSLTVTPADTGCTGFDNASFTLAAGASKQLTCTHVATVADGNSYTNQACAQGVDSIGGANGTVSDCDSVSTTIVHPGIKVTKAAAETAVHVGDTIHYTITVENTGDTALTVTPADTGCTGLAGGSFSLAPGAMKTLTCEHVATAGDGASYKNEACAQGVDSIGGASGTVSDCDDVTTPILHPAIKVTKTAGEAAVHVGDTIHYTIKVENTGDVALTVTPADTGCTGLNSATFPLAAGDSKTLTCEHVAIAGDGASYKNEACAKGVDTLAGTVSDCDDVTTPILHPGIKVTKTAPEQTAHVGDTIHYSVKVENTGDTALTVTPSDLGCTSFDSSSFSLAAGASTTLTCQHLVTAGDGASYKNEACATGVDSIGGKVSDCGDVTTEVIHPAIKVVKSANPTTTHDAASVIYSYDVTNGGDTPLANVHVVDDKCASPTYVSGDANNDNKLDLGETWKYTCDYTVKHSDEAGDHTITNTVTADGTDKLGKTVSDDDKATILVVHPAIQVTKKADESSVHVGETIHYTVTVKNTGDVDLTVTPSDTGCDAFASGDFTLAAGASKDLTCTHVAQNADGASYKNEACADGADGFGGKVSDCGDVTTEIIQPGIKVVKTADPKVAHDGDPVSYGYTVTNEGDTPLSDVHVSDDKCSPVNAITSGGHNVGDTNGDDKLDTGEAWKYTCDYTVKHIDENGSGDITNVVVADGTDKLGKTVTDDDSQTIHIVHPAIVVTKTATEPAVHVGEPIHYTVTVHNTGDVDLTVSPSDTGCDGFASGDFTLAAGASKDLTCTHVAQGADGASYKNKACAAGDDGHGVTVSDCGDVTTEIIHPAIKVVKSGSPTTVHDGDSVTYNYDVTNGGDTPLANVHVLDDKCDSPTYVSGDANNDNKLDLGETWKYTCAYSATHTDEAGDHTITNTVTADGTDKLGKTVSDDDKFTILVVHPGIKVTKTAGETAVHVGDTIHYTIKVQNTGDTDLTVKPSDAKCSSFDDSSFTLAAGASKTLTCEHVATAGDGGAYSNEACAHGVDSVGGDKGTVNDCDSVVVPILHPGIKVTKTAQEQTAHVGDTIHYTVKIENTGDTDLTVTPSDTKCDGFASGAFTLKAGDSKELTCTHVVTADDGTSYKNVACANGVDSIEGKVSDCGEITTEVIHPAIHIDKTERVQGDASYVDGPIDTFVGDTVEYEMKVTNPGDTPLDVTFTDAHCDNGTLSGPTGDSNSDGKLDPSETWTYHCSHFVPGADKPSFTNTAHVDGTDKLDKKVSDEDSVVANIRDFQIAGTKFEDQNANGKRDAGEPGIANWTIYLDANDNGQLDPGETSLKTDANGDYSFNSLDPGSYVVREVLPAGWHCSTPSPCEYRLTLKSRDPDKAGIDFGNWHDSSVAGVKFHDRNANGARDAGEEGLGGWTFYVDYNGNGVKDGGEPSATSGADGSYKIDGIKPGTYAVREVGQAGWTCSAPASCEYDLTFKSNDAKTGADFGNWEPASVSGTKFQDTNNNGVHDAGEGPLQGFTFYVDYNGNGTLDVGEPSAVSAADGSWTIGGIKPGTFNVLEVADPNYSCTFPGAGDACKYQVTLQAGDQQTGKEFGNAPPAQIVKGTQVTPGKARLLGPTGCVAKAFNARIRGTKVQTVTFVLDGKTIKRIKRTSKSGIYSVRINPNKLQVGVHRLVVSVTFQKGSGTKPKKLRLSFQRCARKLAVPRFTG